MEPTNPLQPTQDQNTPQQPIAPTQTQVVPPQFTPNPIAAPAATPIQSAPLSSLPPLQQTTPISQMPASSNRKKIVPLAIGAAILVALAIAAVVLLGGKKDSTSNNSQPATDSKSITPTENNIPTSTAPAAEQKTETSTAPASTEVAIGKSFKTDLGRTITIEKIKRNVDWKETDTGNEAVFVYVSEVTDGSYSSSAASISTYKLLDAAGKVYDEDSLTMGRKELTAAGYTLIYDAKKEGNNLGKGWLAFQVPAGQKTLTLRYVQKEAKVLNGGTIAAKNYDNIVAQ